MNTISERYCQRLNLPPERFSRHLLWRSLTLQTRLLYPVLLLIPRYFEPDMEFIESLGTESSLEHFQTDIIAFKHHPANRTFLRRKLRFRLSTQKLLRNVRTAIRSSAHGRSRRT